MSIRLLIVEDEEEIRDKYRELLELHRSIDLVGEAVTQEEAWNVIQADSVDAIILDLELPSGSGILLLERMKNLLTEKPFIVVVTHVGSKSIFEAIRALGADYICMKTEPNFSYDTPLSIIEIATPYRVRQESSGKLSEMINRKTLRKTYEKRIRQEFARLGFPEKLQGTMYCKEAVLYMIMNAEREVSVTKDIYPHIASRLSTTTTNVERAIRNAIEKVWLEQPLYKINDSYPYRWDENIGRPSNGDFIKNMSQKIIRQ